jgi:uncharacterized membrane protein YgdD (TMEM256/DUF423 family)
MKASSFSSAPLFLRTAAVLGFLAVALGAFGAHGLAPILEAHGTAAIWNTAVQYHFYHTLALLALGLSLAATTAPAASAAMGSFRFIGWIGWIGLCWSVGIVIFSGSLYILSVTGLRWLGAITPIGGLFFLVGWVLLFFSYRRP